MKTNTHKSKLGKGQSTPTCACMALLCIEARGLPSFGTQYLPITGAHLHAHSLVLHNAQCICIYNTYYRTHTIQFIFCTITDKIPHSIKKEPTFLPARNTCLLQTLICMPHYCMCNPQYCTVHTVHTMHIVLHFSVFTILYCTCAIPVACNLSSSTGTLLRSHC